MHMCLNFIVKIMYRYSFVQNYRVWLNHLKTCSRHTYQMAVNEFCATRTIPFLTDRRQRIRNDWFCIILLASFHLILRTKEYFIVKTCLLSKKLICIQIVSTESNLTYLSNNALFLWQKHVQSGLIQLHNLLSYSTSKETDFSQKISMLSS